MPKIRATATLDPMTRTRAPVLIDVERDRGLTLTWADGTTSRFDLDELRQHCPCAECRTRRERNLPVWPRPSSPRPLRVVNAELVGAWGMSITWNDGHSTGIYSWELLRPDEPPHDS
jgi:DUF971 family protein